MKIESLYMPENCLQGGEFPAHLIWDKSDNIEVTINLPDNISIKNVFNVPSDGININKKNTIRLTKFDVNGYVGLVFISKNLDEVFLKSKIKFQIKDKKSSAIEEFEKWIDLFRPGLVTKTIPSKINVEYNPSDGSYKLDKKISIKNIGAGTAIIGIILESKDDFEIQLPRNMDNFISSVFIDLEEQLNEVRLSFPNYSSLINDYLSLTKPPIKLNEEFKRRIKKINDDFLKAFDENDDFFEQFCWAIGYSYIKNIHLITELSSFMNYLDSIGEGRVLLANYIDVLKTKKSISILKLTIQMTDLAYYNYPSLELPPIEVICEKDCEIPVHVLFNWKDK